MNRIKILFLTFVLSLTSVGGLACWDDWDDDWDDWDDDDEVDDEHDDWYYNEETGDYWLYDVEVTGSNDGILMDEVVVTYDTGSDDDNDTNNEDPWSDTGDGWGNDDYGWEDGEDDNNDDDYSVRGTTSDGDSNSNKGEKDEKGIYRIQCKDGTIIIDVFKCEAYKLQDDDITVVDKLNIPVNYVQSLQASTCFIAGLSLVEQMFEGKSINYESLVMEKYAKLYGLSAASAILSNGVEGPEMEPLLMLMFNHGTEYSKSLLFFNDALPEGLNAAFYVNFLNNGNILMTDIYVASGDWHNIVIFGTTQDGYFLCYDTLTGNILRLTDSDFVHSYIVAISGSNEDAFQK